MIKIAFFDVDGTLLKMGHKDPSDKTIFALQQLRKNGVLICMATGRGYPAVPQFEGIEFDILLTFNGSYVRNKEQVIFSMPLDQEDKFTIVKNLTAMNRAAAVSTESEIVANGTDDALKQYFAFGSEDLVVSADFDRICAEKVFQMMCSATEAEYEQVLKGTRHTQITAWWDKALDIIPAMSGKGRATKAVLDYYGFTPEEALAFGDGRNDIEMLEAVGTGIAMDNAKDEVKARADEICQSVENDGIYYYCVEKQLIHSVD
ncbi:HAD family hydrolase [Alloscardovia criceti]|uniref:HAD family hydrolase n=1 Tax=Alloscardovia criceti TaxID=356828 RepID=UPI00037EB3A1|nr:HAD family hydrolase [Alloscardovia criceti]